MRLPTEPTFRSVDYDNMVHDYDVCDLIEVVYQPPKPRPQPVQLRGSRDYRIRRDGDGWVLESRPGGYLQHPWEYEGRLTGEPPPVDGAIPGVTEYHVTAVGSAHPGEWRIRPGYVDKPSGTCDP